MKTIQHNQSRNFWAIIGSYIKNHPWATSFYVTFGIFWAFTLPYMSYLLGSIIDEIKVHDPIQIPVFKLVMLPLCLYVSIHVLRSIGYFAHALFSLISIPAQKGFLVKKIFHHLCNQSVGYFEERKAGFLSGQITNICTGLEPVISSIFTTIFPQSLAIILTGLLLSSVVPYFGIVLWVWGILVITFTYKAAKIGQQKAGAFADACSHFNGHVIDVVSNIPTVIMNETQQIEK